MVKKKAPVILLTVVVLAFTGVFAMNLRSHPVDPEEAQKEAQAAAMAAQANKPRPADNPTNIQAAMQSSLAANPTGEPKPMMANGQGGGPPPGARGPGMPGQKGMLVAPKQKAYRPMPTDSSTSSQWYR